MLIGIDASRATAARRTGTENYSLHLIRELLAQDSGHHVRLYFNEAPQPVLFSGDLDCRVIPFPRLWTHVRLSREMAASPPDVLFVPSHVLPLLHPRRSVVTVHDLGYHYHPEAHTLSQNLYLRWSTRFNARSSMRVVADSEATRQDLVRLYDIDPEKLIVVYPGRDESLAPVTDPPALKAVRERYGISGPYFLHVGTLHPRKNLVRLVQAMSLAGSDLDRSLQLVLAGKKGWLYDDVLAEVRRRGLSDRVLLTGYLPDADLPAMMSGALAYVFPSLYEGFGLPALEAMACGTPVVCSSASSLPEVAGDAALLFDPLHVEELAAALVRIATDEGMRDDLVGRGFGQLQRFSWSRCAREVMQVLEEVGRGLD
jgi:glycosyltransferase involved in cell wall biosynthesis